MRRAACAGAWLWVFAVAACTPIERQPTTNEAVTVEPVRVQASGPGPAGHVITTLQTRDHEVTVYAGDHGLRFTVAAAGGVVLAQQLSETEFARSFPGLFSRYDSAFAGERHWIDASAARTPVVDAGL